MNWKVQAAFGSAILTLLVIAGVSLASRSEAKESQRWILHTYEVLASLQRMEEDHALAHTSWAAYLAHGDPTDANAFQANLARARLQLEVIRSETLDNPIQQRRLKSLDALLVQEQQDLPTHGHQVASTDRQAELDIAEITDDLQNEELRLLKKRTDENGRRLKRSGATLLVRTLVGLFITMIGAWAVQVEGRRRSRAELALRRGEERIRGLLQSAPDPWIVLNPAGEIVLSNARTEAQFGYTQAELLGVGIGALLPDGLPDELSQNRPEALSREHSIEKPDSSSKSYGQPLSDTVEVTGRRKDGSRFPAEMTISSFTTRDGVLTSAALRDISERRKAECHLEEVRMELERSNQELQRFAYVTSHDLQEPLRMVASYVQLLARRYRNQLDKDADEFIGYAVDGCVRMKRLIQDLLAYSRAGAEEKRLRCYPIDTIVDQAVGNLHSAITESGAVITRDDLPLLVVDEVQLLQIFQNLIGNAIKYRRDEPPAIHISARHQGEEWIFSVQDNGRGIEPEYFQKVFVLFQRLQRDEGSDGTGIGLAICKRMIERLGGRIWVESEPGVGSTFLFAVPATHEENVDSTKAESAKAEAAATR